MALTSIKVSQLSQAPTAVSNEDIIYVVKALPDNTFISVKAYVSDISDLFISSVKEDVYEYIDIGIDQKIEEEKIYNANTYVAKVVGKQLSTLSFEQEDKTELYDLRPSLTQFITSNYVPLAVDKQLSTLSFEREDKQKLYSLEQFTIDRVNEELVRSDTKYVEKVTGKQLSSLSFEQADKTKLDGLEASIDAKVNLEKDRSDAKYVERVVGKQLSTLSFEPEDKSTIYGLDAYVLEQVSLEKDRSMLEATELRESVNTKIAAEVARSEGKYVDKVPGKQLSTLSFEQEDKTKLDGITDYVDSKDTATHARIDEEVLELDTKIDSEKTYNSETYVAKEPGKVLSTLSFEQADKDKLDSIDTLGEDQVNVLNERIDTEVSSLEVLLSTSISEEVLRSDTKYVEKELDKVLTSISFEQEDKDLLDGLTGYIDESVNTLSARVDQEVIDIETLIETEKTFNSDTYVAKEEGKVLSSISFEQADKDKLDGLTTYVDDQVTSVNDRIDDEVIDLEAKIATEKTFSSSTYVAKVDGKGLSSLSFEQADKTLLDSLPATITAATDTEISRSDDKYVAKVTGKQLSTLSFEQVDKTKLDSLQPTLTSTLTGYVEGPDTAVIAEDTVLDAIAKLQGQITALKAEVASLQSAG